MKVFDAPSAYIEAPENWVDASVYTIAGPPITGFSPTVVISRLLVNPEPDLDTYVDSQLADLKLLNKYKLGERGSTPDHEFGPMVRTAFSWVDNDENTFSQHQAFIQVGQSVYTLTTTIPKALTPLWSHSKSKRSENRGDLLEK